MKMLVAALLVASALGYAGCTNTTLSCDTTSCTSGTLTYQTCVTVGGSVTYRYGAASCSASDSNSAQLDSCAEKVADYCTGTTDGGTSTIPTTSSGTCTYTVSGAQTATGTCTLSAYGSPSDGIVFSITDHTTLTFGATLSGMSTLTAGVYTLANAAPGAGAEYLVGTSAVWDMCTSSNCSDGQGNTSTPQGSFTLDVTDPGPETGGSFWSAPKGSLLLTLPAQPSGSASGMVTVNVTL
jgi:hypothetical protein